MKHIFSSLLLVTFFSCAEPAKEDDKQAEKQTEKSTSAEQPKTKTCAKAVNFGSAKICLPEIKGMNECYAHPKVKAKTDAFEFKGNSVLAVYLDDATYKQVDKINEITFGEFFKLYVTDATKDQVCTQSSLDELSKMLEGSYLKENWSDLKSQIEAGYSDIQVGTPVLLESINLHDNVRSFIMITRYQVEDKFTDVVMAANAILIDERLIWMAYYQNYENEKTIAAIKSKNEKVINQLLQANGLQ